MKYMGFEEFPPEKRVVEKVLEMSIKASEAVKSVMNHVFSLYSHLFTKEA